MDEQTNVNEVVEEPIAEEVAEEVSEAEFDEIWEDDGDDAFVEADSEEANQQTEESTTEATGQTEAEQPEAEGADQYLELKHFDEVKKVSKEEAKVLAQKGMDYDRIRGKLGQAEEAITQLRKYGEFLNEIKGDFNSIEDLMNDTRARILSDKEGITYDQAMNRLVNQRPQQPQISRDSVYEEMRRGSLTAFIEAFPGVKAKDIPQEVWDDMRQTNSLVASYAKYQAKKLAEENETLKKNAKNKSRSTGSMKSSGNASYEKSEFDRVMEEDDW